MANVNYNLDTYLAQIARGEIEGASLFSSYGSSDASGAVSNQLVFPNGAYTFYYPDQTTGDAISFVSDSSQDGVGGTGIRSIHVHYLDATLTPASKVITLNGTTAVTGQLTGCRFIQCMHVETYGTGKAADGNIIAYLAGAATPVDNVTSIIHLGDTRCSSSMRMVPAGKKWFIFGAAASSISATADASSIVDIFATQIEGHNYFEDFVRVPLSSLGLQNSAAPYKFPTPIPFTEGAVVGAQFTANKAATCTVSLFGWLENKGAN